MMMRYIGFWMALLLIVGGTVLKTNLEARQREDKLARIEAQIEAEKSRIRVLTAEWYSLTSPERLQKLSGKYLELAPVNSMQIALATDVPEKLQLPAVEEGTAPVAVANAQPVAQPAAQPLAQLAAAPKPAKASETLENKIATVMKTEAAKPVATKAPAAVAAAKPAPEKAELKLAKAEQATKVAPQAATKAAVKDDMISQLIEREAPHNMLWASYEDKQ